MERLVSGSRIDLIGPCVDHGLAVEVVEVSQDPRLEFLLGCDAHVAEHGPGHLGEEPLHEVEPGAVFGGEHQAEAALRLGSEPVVGLLGGMCRVVVEDQLNGGVGGIGGVDLLEEGDELPRAMPVLDTGVNCASE